MRDPITGNTIPKGWRIVKVDDIKSSEKYSCVAGPFGSDISSKYFKASGVPIIRGNNLSLKFEKFIPEDFAYVSLQRARKYKAQHVKHNDLIFTCWGTLGQVGIIPRNGPYNEYIISNKQLKLRVNKEIVNPLYLYYYFSSLSVVKYIKNIAIGAAVPGINLGLLKRLPISLPPKKTQDKIADILDTYSTLIDNNNQRIQLLEEMAEETYKEWFVRLRFPGYQDAIFRDKTGKPVPQGTEGALPEGWEKSNLTNIANIADGTHDSPKKADSGYALITGKSIKNGFINLCDSYLISTEDHNRIQKRSYTNVGDTILSNIGTVGSAALVFDQTEFSVKNVIILRPKTLAFSSFIHSWVQSNYTQKIFQNEMTGASQQFLSLGYMRKFRLILPTKEILIEFDQLVGKIYTLRFHLFQKNQVLQQTRDLLLPRLISGKLSVEELDIATVEAS